MMGEFRTRIHLLVSRTEHVKRKMAEFTKLYNLMIDAKSVLEKEVERLSSKVLDLVDRSRCNNIRIRGIPKAIPPDLLPQFLTDVMAITLPSAVSLDLTID